VREVIERRLETLGDEVRAVLDLAAVVGGAFDLALLEASSGAEPADDTGADGGNGDPAESFEMRPDLIVADPEQVAPGERVALIFPDETGRGLGSSSSSRPTAAGSYAPTSPPPPMRVRPTSRPGIHQTSAPTGIRSRSGAQALMSCRFPMGWLRAATGSAT
jgi:hypothetical protein